MKIGVELSGANCPRGELSRYRYMHRGHLSNMLAAERPFNSKTEKFRFLADEMTKNDNYLPQMAEEGCGHQSNDSVQLIGFHFSHGPGYVAC